MTKAEILRARVALIAEGREVTTAEVVALAMVVSDGCEVLAHGTEVVLCFDDGSVATVE